MGMTKIATDERGRVTIPKKIRDRFGERYRMIELQDGVKLLPVPDDPATALREASSEEFKQASMDELQTAALEEAQEQTDEHVR